MTDSPNNPGPDQKKSDVRSIRSVGRSRLLQAGLSAAPVVMTVARRPGLAQGGNCQSPSGFVSGNASSAGNATCTGLTPAHWVTATWPGGSPALVKNNPGGTRVKDIW